MPTTPPNNNTGLYGSSASSPSIPTNNTSGLYGIDNGAVYVNNDVVADQISANSIVSNTITTTGNVTVGGTLIGNVLGSVTGSVTGNVTGNFAGGNITANYATISNDLTVIGNIYGNISGNISGNIIVPGGNTEILFNNNGNAGASNNFTFNDATNIMTLNGTADLGNLTVQAGGNIDMGLNRVGNVDDPLAGTDAATKNYVDSQLSSDIFVVTDGVTSVGVAKGETVTFDGVVNETTVFVTNSNNEPIITVGLPDNVTITGNLSANTANITNNLTVGGTIFGNLSGNISGNITVPGSNSQVLYNLNGNAGASADFTFDDTANLLTLTGTANVTGNVNATGNVAGNYFLGNGALLSGIATSISGNLQGNLLGNGFGISNVAFLTSTGNISTTGNISATGRISATGNINTPANMSANNLVVSSNANITTGFFTTVSTQVVLFTNSIFGVGPIAGSNFTANGQVSASGNVIGANILSNGYASITGNVTGGNILTGGLISATGNVTAGNVLFDGGVVSGTGNVLAGNVIGTYLWGDGSNITGVVAGAQSVQISVKNTSGGTLVKGTPVYPTGTVGASTTLEIAAARADDATKMPAIGLLETTLNNNDQGYAISVGTLRQIDTSTYTIGTTLYVAPTGGITPNRPNDGYKVQPIGTVGRVNATNGSIDTNVWNYFQLPNLGSGNMWIGNANSVPIETAAYSNSNVAAYLLTNTGNIAAGNVLTTGMVSAAGNIIGGNITTVGTITSGPVNITGNVDVTGNVNVTGNLNYDNVTDLVVGDPLIYLGANNTGNVYDLGFVVSYDDGLYQHGGFARDASDGTWKIFGNVVAEPTTTIDFANAIYQPLQVGSMVASTTIIANGNIAAANVTTTGSVSATGNITGSYIIGNGSQLTGLPAGYSNANAASFLADFGSNVISTSGNVTSGNVLTGGIVSATGNVTGNYFIGNGSQLTGIQTGLAGNMTGNIDGQGYNIGNLSNVNIANGGNIRIGTVLLVNNNVSPPGLVIDGTLELQDVTIFNGDLRIQDGNGVNFYDSDNTNYVGFKGPSVVATNIEWTLPAADGTSAQALSTYGNGILYWNTVNTYGNSNVANFLANLGSNAISSTGNVTAGNILTNGLMSAAGNITSGGNIAAGYFIGDGSQLTNLPASTYSNVNVAAFLGSFGSNVISSTGNITSTANISGGNILTTGIMSATANVTGGNILTAGLMSATGNVTSAGNVSAGNVLATTGLYAGSLRYTATDGTNGQVLTTYGNGVTYFSTVSGGGGGGSNIANGTSNISINTANGNATVGIGGTANTTIFTANGLTTLQVTTSGNNGNISGVNVYIGNQIQGQAANSAVTIKNYKDAAFTVTYASTITPDVSNGSLQTVTLTGNVTFSAFTNPQAGQSLIMIVKQDTTGNRLLTSTMKFAGNVRTLSTAANAIDIISCFYDGSTYFATLSTGYA